MILVRLKSHIKIANNTLDSVQDKVEWRVRRLPYILGSIAPDLNIAFPKHTIKYTMNRLKRRVGRLDNTKSDFIRSFTLGVIIHYICDYFCYVHNINSQGPKHVIYERILNKHIINQEYLLCMGNETIEEEWENIRLAIETKGVKSIREVCESGWVIDAIIQMNKVYMDRNESITNKQWHLDMSRIKSDIAYAEFVSIQVILIMAGGIKIKSVV